MINSALHGEASFFISLHLPGETNALVVKIKYFKTTFEIYHRLWR